MDAKRFSMQLQFLREIDQVKSVFRNTILLDQSRRENDAEHSWHMAVCAMLLLEYANDKNIDMGRTLKMILLHDVIEIYSGDTFAYDPAGIETQDERERLAADRLFSLLPADQNDEFRSIWDEFEERSTSEAKFAHSVDRFMPIYHNYMTQGLRWREMGVTKTKVLTRNQTIRDGSEEIWSYVCEIVNESVEKGYLADV